MGLDIRIPLGLMFLITGAILAAYGLFTFGGRMYDRSLGYDLNLGWGAVLFLFGLVMYLMGRRDARRNRPPRR